MTFPVFLDCIRLYIDIYLFNDIDYIYRGEPECYEKVSSSLYREYGVESEYFDIEVVQEEILNEAKKYTHETDEFEILTQLQHFGG